MSLGIILGLNVIRVLILTVVAAVFLWLTQIRIKADLSSRGMKKSDWRWWAWSVVAFLPVILLLYAMWGMLERLGV
jgi:hypothetical protein